MTRTTYATARPKMAISGPRINNGLNLDSLSEPLPPLGLVASPPGSAGAWATVVGAAVPTTEVPVPGVLVLVLFGSPVAWLGAASVQRCMLGAPRPGVGSKATHPYWPRY